MRHLLTVGLSPNAPREVRHSFDQHSDQFEESLLNDVRVLSSEIVANAVQHSGRPQGDPITVDTTVQSDVLRVEVVDQGDGAPPLRPRSSTPPSGLGYVDRLSDRWSSQVVSSFQVWFEIDVKTNGLIERTQSR